MYIEDMPILAKKAIITDIHRIETISYDDWYNELVEDIEYFEYFLGEGSLSIKALNRVALKLLERGVNYA